MTNMYLDIETTGFNPEKDIIISIQYQEIGSDGKPRGSLVILKEWEGSEKEIVEKFHKILLNNNVWSFIPIGYNLIFDLTFLWAKFKKYNLPLKDTLSEYLYNKPLIDVKYSIIIGNNLNFKGAGLDKVTGKNTDGREVPLWYRVGDFERIENYIKQETESFMKFFEKLKIKLTEVIGQNGAK